MDKTRFKLLHLHRSRGVTRPLIRNILKVDSSLENLYHYSPATFRNYFSLSNSRANELFADLHNENIIKSILEDLKYYKTITILDCLYPPLLRMIKDPPFVLYYLGNEQLLFQLPSLSVVGTRNPTKEAKQKMMRIIQPLVKRDWTIVSGLALGIDGIAHQIALDTYGKTIAVLGSGLQHIYPPQHKTLFNQLIDTQLVLSEYPPNYPPKKYYFPERNRIISGLSFGTIVIEARERSGSLITVDQALDQGREVYAVPGSPLNEQTSGCHKMIQDGAKLVQNTHDLLEEWELLGPKWSRIMADMKENASY